MHILPSPHELGLPALLRLVKLVAAQPPPGVLLYTAGHEEELDEQEVLHLLLPALDAPHREPPLRALEHAAQAAVPVGCVEARRGVLKQVLGPRKGGLGQQQHGLHARLALRLLLECHTGLLGVLGEQNGQAGLLLRVLGARPGSHLDGVVEGVVPVALGGFAGRWG